MDKSNRKGIALLVTLFFLMAISISIGIGLKHVNEAKSSIKDENFLLQTNIILDDVLAFLENMPEMKYLKKDKIGDALDIFLAQSEFIPFEAEGIKVGISIKSARRKINLNELLDLNISADSVEPQQLEYFKAFLSGYGVNMSYVDMLKDSVSKYNINYTPSTDILDAKPDIFRDYIASYEHLEEINEYYKDTYYENSLAAIDFKDLFYLGRDSNNSYCIDSYYMSTWTIHMLTGMSLEEAEENEGHDFISGDDSNETDNIMGFRLCKSTDVDARKFLDVHLEIIQDEKTANISFEYDILNAKGYNFSYEI